MSPVIYIHQLALPSRVHQSHCCAGSIVRFNFRHQLIQPLAEAPHHPEHSVLKGGIVLSVMISTSRLMF